MGAAPGSAQRPRAHARALDPVRRARCRIQCMQREAGVASTGPAGVAGPTDDRPEGGEHLESLLERLRREPALRSWGLTAPTGALASLGLALDDTEIVMLLDQIEAMEGRPLPVTARDVMTADPITVRPEAGVHEAAELLSEHRVSGLPVRDANGNLVGILSEFDLIARSGRTVGEVMTRDVVSVREQA